ncbi:MAG TPA: aminoglycoside phosphotransferase family protein [Anaerolineales bacterium]|nr:aminoglycoside phosphotransferase family protein [Anaerolineales bacterium]
MDKTEKYLQHIRALFPSLSVITARLNDQGQSNDGLIVNEEFIFRFPKHASALRKMRAEFDILRALQGRTTLRVPDPICFRLDTDIVGEAFFGYRLIPGEPFLQETFRSIREEAVLNRVAEQVAGFLGELHSFRPGNGFELGLPRRDTREEWVGLLTKIREQLLPELSREESVLIIDYIESFMVDDENFDYAPVLRHGDFGTVNVLYDPAGKRLSGVIDFGNAGLGDPALDLAAVLAPSFGYGEAFFTRLTSAYAVDEPLLRRARFYVGTFSLQEALYGVEHGIERIFREGLEDFSKQAVGGSP